MDKSNGLSLGRRSYGGHYRKDYEDVNNTNIINSDTKTTQDKEQGQIQDVIGHFGKYQLLIFIFKILIGVTSAFNNLSVTFFAPRDFISYTCVTKLNATNINHQHQHLVNNTILNFRPLSNPNDYHVHPAPSLENPSSLINLTSFNNDNNTQTSIRKSSLNNNLFYEFLFSEERKERHQKGFNTDTPRGLKKECKYYSNEDKQYHKCKSFKYDTGIWLSTIINEWDLVCDRAWFVSMTQSLYMSGFIVSFLVFGYISDRFGRWKSLLFGALIEVLSGFGCAFATSVTSFMIFRFLLGLGNAGRSSSSYLIMIEWAGPKWRMHISTLGSLGWVIGYCAMPWITLYFLNFRHMQLFVCFYELLFIFWLLRLPESPRWLLTHKKFNEAYDVLLMAAKFNGLIEDETKKPIVNSNVTIDNNQQQTNNNNNKIKLNFMKNKLFSDIEIEKENDRILVNNASIDDNNSKKEKIKLLSPYSLEEFNLKFKHLINTIDAKDFTKNEDNLSIIDLFKWHNLRKYAIILFFVWASNSFIYYGIVLRVGDFGGKNLFKTFTIAGITELPSIAFTMLCMKFMPRKATNLFIFITTGLLCALQLPLKYYEYQWLQQGTMLLAKLFNSCSFTVILYQTMELFPTSIRQTAYSSCSLAGRVGSILAPFIKELAQSTNDSVPPVIYASLSAIAAFLIIDLPETKGSDLPDTLLEAERIEDKRPSNSCSNKQPPTGVITTTTTKSDNKD